MNLWKGFDNPPREGVALAPLTTWKIGGPARWYAEPVSLSELGMLLSRAERQGVRVYLLGGGSNLLVNDAGLNGLVIRLSTPTFQQILLDEDKGIMRAGGGVPLSTAVRLAAAQGFAGLEYLSGIPGSLGGGVCMNCGSGAHTLGLVVEEVGVVDMAGRFNRLRRNSLFFSYRVSNLDRLVVTDLVMRLRPDSRVMVEERRERILHNKQQSQPLGVPSAGCVFKNPKDGSAGQLIDSAGCKGLRVGDAVVSDLHANFFVNTGKATFRDMMRLIELVRMRVEEVHGIELSLEIKLWI